MRPRIFGLFDGYRSALRHRDVRLLFAGLLVSATGGWAYNVGLIAFVYGKTHSLTWVSVAGVVRFIPALVLSPYSGVVAERTERIRLMVGSDLLCTVWQAGLLVVGLSNGPVVLALALACLSSATAIVYSPAVAATIPSLVGEDDLISANALNSTIENLVVILGPAVGAGLLLIGSPSVVFAANTGSFAISALLVSRIRARTTPVDVTEAGAAGVWSQVTLGAKTIMSMPAARTLVAFCALVSFVYGTDTVLFVGVSADKLGTGTEGFGYLLAGLGVGGILMAVFVDKLAGWTRLGPIIILGVAGYTLPTALLTVITSPGLAFALEVVRGGSTLIVDVLAITALQRSVPSDQLARVFGVFFAFVIAAITLGALITPQVIRLGDLDTGILTMAFAPFVIGVAGYPALVSIDRASAARTAVLAPRVALLEQLEIFAAASRTLLERLAGSVEEQTFGPGQAIVREGEPADALYVLFSGGVVVTATGEGGSEVRTLRTMTAPSYFGEIGVLERIPRTATVTAADGGALCYLIPGQTLLDALQTAAPSSSLLQNARARLSLTHPSQQVSFAVEVPDRA